MVFNRGIKENRGGVDVGSKNINRFSVASWQNESLRRRRDCAFTALFSGKLLNGRLSRVSVGAKTISGVFLRNYLIAKKLLYSTLSQVFNTYLGTGCNLEAVK